MNYLILLPLILSISSAKADPIITTGSAAAGIAAGGVMSIAINTASAGSGIMKQTCGSGPYAYAMCVTGAALVATAIVDAKQSDHDHNVAAGLTPGQPGYSTPAQDAIAPQVGAANQIAAGQGTTLGALAAQAPTGAGSGAGGSGQAGVGGDLAGAATGADGQGADAAAAGNKSGYKVSSVGTDGGGGGGRAPASAGGPDLGGLLAGLNGSKSGASGLQKTLNGEPIGVASDNIFTKVTQAYQAKKTAQTFLPTGN